MKFSVRNFGIVEKADFAVDQITIIAAPNDAGKTSMLRLICTLHSVFFSTSFETLKDSYFKKVLRDITHRDSRFRSIYNFMDYNEISEHLLTLVKTESLKSKELVVEHIFGMWENSRDNEWEEFEDEFSTNHEDLRVLIREYLDQFIYQQKLNSAEPVEYYLTSKIKEVFKGLADNVMSSGTEATFSYEKINSGLKDGKVLSKSAIEFPVDFKDSFSTIYFEEISMLGRFLNPTPRRIFWGGITVDNEQFYTRKLIRALKHEPVKKVVLTSDVKNSDYSPYSLMRSEDSKSYFFVKNNEPDSQIEMSNIPKGVLLISYIQKLIINGTLKKNSLLIIDEPENHLHQDWQATLAQFLYYISVDYKIKIIMATHSAVMIETFEALKNNNDKSKIRFYNGVKGENGYVRYDDCTSNTTPIYNSFMSGFRMIDKILSQQKNNEID